MLYVCIIIQMIMQTNVIMISEDRKLFGIKIRQETKTGFLNLSDLMQAYENQRQQYSYIMLTMFSLNLMIVKQPEYPI